MAVGQVRPGLNIPSPLELAGGPSPPVVTPSAVTQMTEALRQGFLTADDIIARTGKQAQLKEKANVLALTEQISPEAVQARQQSLRAGLAQSQLGAAQAQAALPLVQPTAALQQQQLEQQVAYQKYPAAKLFDQYAPVLGLEEPQTSDKQIDWSRKASIGVQIAEHLRLQNEAKEKLANLTTEKSADGTVISAFTKQGLPVNSTEVQKLETQARSPFRAMTPGTVQTSASLTSLPQILPLQSSPNVVAKWRAQLINEGIDTAAQMADSDVARIMESRRNTPVTISAPTSVAKPVIEVTPAIGQPVGGGFSLGPPKATDKPAPHYTETQQKALTALARSLSSDNILLNKQQQADPNFNPADVKSQLRMKAYKGGTTGQIAATLGQITQAERQYATASNAWIQGLLRAESGAAIAAKEQVWYENTFFPAVGDPPAIQQQKNNLRKAIEQTFEQVIQGKMTPEEYQNYRDTISAAAGVSSPAPQGNTFEIQGIGKVFRGADGKMYRQ